MVFKKRKNESAASKPADSSGVIEDDTSKNSRVVVSKFSSSRISAVLRRVPKEALVVLVVFVLVFVLASGFFMYRKSQNKPACSSELLGNASAYLSPGQAEQLKPFKEEIEKQNSYERDANCMFVVVTYDLNIGDTELAEEHLRLMEQNYDKFKPLAPELGLKTSVTEELRKDLDLLRTQREQLQQLMKAYERKTD